jgi:hypothetical protein
MARPGEAKTVNNLAIKVQRKRSKLLMLTNSQLRLVTMHLDLARRSAFGNCLSDDGILGAKPREQAFNAGYQCRPKCY